MKRMTLLLDPLNVLKEQILFSEGYKAPNIPQSKTLIPSGRESLGLKTAPLLPAKKA